MHTAPYTIGITGGSGSGKSFLIQQLKKKFTREELAILSQDNYYRKREHQEIDAEGVRNFDLPASFVMDDFARDVQKLIHGETVEREKYTYNNEAADTDRVIVSPAPVVIIEGLFIFYPDSIRDVFDLKIFVDANDVMKLKRRILRDRVERNYPLEDVLYRYEHHVLPAYKAFIEPHKIEADVIINNSKSLERGCELIAGFIRGMLG
ncbi:MAG: uridine kinase [Saprospiraceae bacterium]|nr:uridine kinase [Saprospiraceae bacterium]